MSSSVPPPPPPPRSTTSYISRKQSPGVDKDSNVSNDPFTVSGTEKNTEYNFAKNVSPGSVPLRTVVGQYLDAPQSGKASAVQIYNILGRLRCLAHCIAKYNSGFSAQSAEFFQYWRRHTLELLSGFGFRPGPTPEPLVISGLEHLIQNVESVYKEEISEARKLIHNGLITFDALSELFRPDIPVQSMSASGPVPCAFRVTDAFYEERRALFGTQKQFRVSLECVVLVGDHYSLAGFSEVISAWSGVRNRPLSDFQYQPISNDQHATFHARGQRYTELGSGGAKYLAYSSNSFHLHAARDRRDTLSMTQSKLGSVSLAPGRIMVDMARGASLGHYPCQGIEEASLAVINVANRYRQWLSKKTHAGTTNTELTVWETVPPEFMAYCWPALVGFSFTVKVWGHVLIDGLSEINFFDQAFERLVLSSERKELIQAVVRHGTSATQAQDVIGGKQGGLVFLLHGPPGVGKTLTAEAVAEVLHRPLYYVTMGELGLTPDDLERRLSDVLGLCAEWNAIAVLDEADVFLETRGTSDLVRNAMVCVMLRILEYHPGILFMTTNRVRTLDPAFESRITIAIRYEALGRDARRKVWRNQLEGVVYPVGDDIDYEYLATQELNGRQIKNAVRLALSLAADRGSPLVHDTLAKTLEVTSLGRRNMEADDAWEKLERVARKH